MKRDNKVRRQMFLLIWPYLLMVLVMGGALGIGITIGYRSISRSVQEETTRALKALSDEVYERVIISRKTCDVLAATNGIVNFPRSMEAGEEGRHSAIQEVKSDIAGVMSIISYPYADVEVYYPVEQVIISEKRDYRGQDACVNRLMDQSGDILQNNLGGMSVGNAWRVCYSEEKTWLIRQMTEHDKIVAYIIMEFNMDQFVPLDSREGFVFVGSEDTVYYCSDETMEKELQEELLMQIREGSRKIRYGNRDYLITRSIFSLMQSSVVIGLSLARGLNADAELPRMILILILIFLICLLIVFRIMYKRVLMPYRYLAEATWEDTQDNAQDVLTLARANLMSLKSQAVAAEEEKQLLLHLGVGDLLQQVRTAPEDSVLGVSTRCLSLAGIFPGQRYMIFSVFRRDEVGVEPDSERWNQEKSRTILEEILRELLFQGRVGVITTMERYYVIVATCQEADTEERLNDIVNRLTDHYRDHYRITVAATQPVIGENAGDLKQMIRQTMNDVSYLYFWQKNRVEEEAVEETEGLISFLKAMRNLINRLDSQDYAGAKEVFNQIMNDNLPRSAQEFSITKYRIYGMMEMLIAAISELPSSEEDTIAKLDYEKRLYENETLSSFINTTEDIFMELIDLRQQLDMGDSGSHRLEAVRTYIDQHYRENSLTATFVAEQFGLSSSYISREFKRIFGCNMLEYIQRLRVEEVKRLLVNYSVKEAAVQAGFWDAQGLVRVFKKYEGITPGEYKKSLSQ